MKNELKNPEFIIKSLFRICENKNVDPLFFEIKISYEKNGFINDRQLRYLRCNLPKYEKYLTDIKTNNKEPNKIQIVLSQNMVIYKAPKIIIDHIKKVYTINNPKWFENSRMGRWQGDTPKTLKHYQEDESLIYLPIGCMEDIENVLKENELDYDIKDNRIQNPVKFAFKGTLKELQVPACNDLLKHNTGTLVASTGAGKTVCGLYIAAKRSQKTLVIVHTKELLYQWIERAESFLNVSKGSVGIIGDGKFKIGAKLTIALVQSCYKKILHLQNKFGLIIVDECHRCPNRQFINAVHFLNAKYKLGLTATPTRRDGLSKLIFWHLGEIRHKISEKKLIEKGDIVKPYFKFINTEFVTDIDPVDEYSKMLSELTKDSKRNSLIVSDINGIDNKVCLIISDRKNHLFDLYDELKNKYGKIGEILIGDTKPKERKKIIAKVNSGDCKWLFATGQLIGEGFDCKNLDRLFMCTPIKFKGRVLQYIGRIMRPGLDGERPVVYDYVDQYIKVLVNSAEARAGIYGKENII